MFDSTSALYGFAGGILATMGVFAGIISLALFVLLIIGWWKIFTKAGEPGWKSLIPVYNIYTLYKITWETKYFWYMIAITVVSGILSGIGGWFCGLLASLCSIATLVISIMQSYRMAKAFGHGGGYTVGLVLVPSIFVLILGFGSSTYQGKTA